MIEVQVHIPDPRSTVEAIAERMRQQISDAAGGDDTDCFEFITSTYGSLVRLHG
jgi:hypothetical protein